MVNVSIAALAVSALWVLALLASFALLRDAAGAARGLAGAALGFGTGTVLCLLIAAQPNWVGVLIGAGAFWRLIAGPLPRIAPFLAGLLAAIVAALHSSAGIAAWQAAAVSAAALLAVWAAGTRWQGQTPSGARPRIPAEGMLLIAALAAPAIGLLADLLFGWQSAMALNIDLGTGKAPPPPAWAIAIVGFAFLAGLLKGAWRRR